MDEYEGWYIDSCGCGVGAYDNVGDGDGDGYYLGDSCGGGFAAANVCFYLYTDDDGVGNGYSYNVTDHREDL